MTRSIKNIFIILLFILLQQNTVFAKIESVHNDSLARSEFDYRMQMTFNRLTDNKIIPEFTEQFILADVNIDPSNPRRFYNYSGDLSGRYIEVLSMADKKNTKINLPQLVKKLITFQKPDGRFGSDELIFSEDKISGEHMALLWGNGRLLVGLMQYYKEYKDEDALKAARKLGDFFISSYGVCSTPAVSKRLDGLMAMGIICFTQYIEGLVLLSEYSHDPKYAQIAAKTYQVLPPRGKQHTHGYLSTLRGVLMLYNYDHQKEHLDYVKSQYEDLIHSDDYTPFGSVREYFGHMDVDRDEGCAHADFVRLSFDLYKATGNKTYFDKGEFALLNALYFNQYYTGDFGHHVLTSQGSSPDMLHASWWCCTMHGLRAMYEVKNNYLAEETEVGVRINLYVETTYTGNNIVYTIKKDGTANDFHFYSIKVNNLKPNSGALELRMPDWAEIATIWVNGKKLNATAKQGYISIDKVHARDVIRIGFLYKTNIHTVEGNIVELAQLTKKPVTGYLHYGPYLLGADDKMDAIFTAEPNDNIVYITEAKPANIAARKTSTVADAYYSIRYKHGGFPSDMSGTLRPVSTLTFDKHGYLMTKLVFAARGSENSSGRNESMIAPFDPNQKPQVKHNKINKVIILGNSIVSHPSKPDIGWTGNWGMAASCSDSDFVHVLTRKILALNKHAEVKTDNVGAFELNYSTINLEEFKSIREFNPDMIIIKISENVNGGTAIGKDFLGYYKKLLQYLDPKGKAVKIIVDGFMPNLNVNKIVQQVAIDGGYDFVSITSLFDDKTNTAKGKFAHEGVAAHPCDKGMRLIAERIWSSIQKYF